MLTPFWVVAARLASHDYRWHLPVECERRLLKICGHSARRQRIAEPRHVNVICGRTEPEAVVHEDRRIIRAQPHVDTGQGGVELVRRVGGHATVLHADVR